MRDRFTRALLIVGFTAVVSAGLAARTQHEHPPATQHPAAGGAHRHPEAAAIKNPVPADEKSIAAGKQVYDKQCAGCHGDAGKGDGTMGAELNPKPANLTDADWKHGSSDGEIFTLISNGINKSPMKGYKSKLTANQIWSVVNYLRTLGPHTH